MKQLVKNNTPIGVFFKDTEHIGSISIWVNSNIDVLELNEPFSTDIDIDFDNKTIFIRGDEDSVDLTLIDVVAEVL